MLQLIIGEVWSQLTRVDRDPVANQDERHREDD